MKNILPPFQAHRLKPFFQLLDDTVFAGVFDIDVLGAVLALAESDDLGRADVFLQIVQHIFPGRFFCENSKDLFPFFTVEGVVVGAAPVCPGLCHQLFAEAVDFFLPVNDQYIDDVLCETMKTVVEFFIFLKAFLSFASVA